MTNNLNSFIAILLFLFSSNCIFAQESCCSPITAGQLEVSCEGDNLMICFPELDCKEGAFNSFNFNMFPINGGVAQTTGTPITNSFDNPISSEGNCFTVTTANGFDPNVEYAIYPYHFADCDEDGEVELIPEDYITTDPYIFEGCETCCDNVSFSYSSPCANLLKICHFGLEDCGGISGLGLVAPSGSDLELLSSKGNCSTYRASCGATYSIRYNNTITNCDIKVPFVFICDGGLCPPENPHGDSEFIQSDFQIITSNLPKSQSILDNISEEVSSIKTIIPTVVPNPFKGEFEIQLSTEQAENYQLVIYNQQGQSIHQMTGNLVKGYNNITVNRLNEMPTGIYYYQLVTETNHFSNKVVKR